MEVKDIVAALEQTKAAFLSDAKNATDIAVKEAVQAINAKLENIKGLPADFDATKLQSDLAETVKGFNELQAKLSKGAVASTEKKSFGVALMEGVEKEYDAIQKALSETGKYRLNLKAVGNMTLGANLTGDSVATYNQRQAILPAQAVNFRDLIPTTQSPTGLYVTYRETGSEGAIAAQTEGSAKGQIDYDLTEVKTVNSYLAGFARFSKQMMKSLPFFEGTLSRMLLRDFYKAENASFFSTVSAAATGVTTVVSTNNVEELIELIANQKTANFTPSYVLVSEAQMARLIIGTFNKGYYAGAGAVQIVGQGLLIWGVPIISASWVTDDKALVIDAGYLERVEVEGLNVQFSLEDGDNFTKNLVTARIECYEAINLMLPASAIYADFGNV
jgi:hypothetical protein